MSPDRAIDPLALILSGEVYVKLTLPDPGPEEVVRAQIRALLRTASPQERRRALYRARAMGRYVQLVEEELATLGAARAKRVDVEAPSD